MIDPEQLTDVVRGLRRAPILPPGSGTRVSYARTELQRLLPHRPPMLLVDAIDAIDLSQPAVRGSRTLRGSDLGFAGHFDDQPIYPGVLTVEAMGQLALTLVHFAGARTTAVPDALTPAAVRATHIHHAAFFAPLGPGDRLTLHARVVEDGGLTMIAAGQAYKGDTLAALAVSEVYVDA